MVAMKLMPFWGDTMQPDISWLIGNMIEHVDYDQQTGGWLFSMGDQMSLAVYCPWKIVSRDRVLLANGDHGQQYGLSATIDASAKAMELLLSRKIESARCDKVSADLMISLTDDMVLRTFGDSSGFESWQLIGPQGFELVAQGNGNIVVYNLKKDASP
jgi:hypothetical protein